MPDVMAMLRGLFVVGLCAVVFGFSWAVTAPGGWGLYGAILALFGFIFVTLVVVARLLAGWVTRPLDRWIHDGHGNYRPLPPEISERAERLLEERYRRIHDGL